jgi:hypothetical protein
VRTRSIRNIVALFIALILVGSSLYRWERSRSAAIGLNTADQIARVYAIKHHLVHVPIQSVSTQFQVRRAGSDWRLYYFVEFPSKYGQIPRILEITVGGWNDKVVATDLSQKPKSPAQYPITGFYWYTEIIHKPVGQGERQKSHPFAVKQRYRLHFVLNSRSRACLW